MGIVLDAPLQAIEPLIEAGNILPLILDPLLQTGDSPAIAGDDSVVGVRGLLSGLEFGTCGSESLLVVLELLARGLNILTVAREGVLRLHQRDAVLSHVFLVTDGVLTVTNDVSVVLGDISAVTGDTSMALGIGYHGLRLGE